MIFFFVGNYTNIGTKESRKRSRDLNNFSVLTVVDIILTILLKLIHYNFNDESVLWTII